MAWEKDLEQLHRRRELAAAQGGEVNVGRQHAAGRLTVRERIDQLVDPGSFQEIERVMRPDFLSSSTERLPLSDWIAFCSEGS